MKCPYCGYIHDLKCPLVKAFEYNPNGSLKRVEFFDVHRELDVRGPDLQGNLGKISFEHLKQFKT